MKTYHLFASFVFTLLYVFAFSNCNEGRTIYIESSTYEPSEFDVPQEGGTFTVNILNGNDCKFGWASVDSASNVIETNATRDTIEAAWFTAVMKGDSCDVIEISVLPNDTQKDREGVINMWRGKTIGGNYDGFILFRQSAN